MTSLTLNLSIFLVVLAAICFSAPVVDNNTTMAPLPSPTTKFVPRAFEEKNETVSTLSFTTEKAMEEITTMKTKTPSKSSDDKESEESRETREIFEMNTSESPMFVTEKSALYTTKDIKYDQMITTAQPVFDETTKKTSVMPSTTKMIEQEIPRQSSTTMKMISASSPMTSTFSPSSSKSPKKYVGRLEDQSEPLEDVETTTKPPRRTTKKPVAHHEEEQHEPLEELATGVSVTEDNELKGDFKVAEYDPKALDFVSTLETVRMQYDENNQSVSGVSLELTTMMNMHEEHPIEETTIGQKEKTLDQGQESSIAEEEKSNH